MMNRYKFTKPNNPRSLTKEYATLEEAQAFASSYDGGGWNIKDLAIPSKTPEEKLQADKAFLLNLLDEFVIQNRLDGITPTESGELLTAFSNIKQLSEVGAVPEVYGSISDLTPPIGRVYTEERKQTDLAKISEYLAIR